MRKITAHRLVDLLNNELGYDDYVEMDGAFNYQNLEVDGDDGNLSFSGSFRFSRKEEFMYEVTGKEEFRHQFLRNGDAELDFSLQPDAIEPAVVIQTVKPRGRIELSDLGDIVY